MHMITRPLTQLGRQMDEIAKGAFDSNFKKQKNTKIYEIRTLQRDFQRMVTALKSFSLFVPVDIVKYLLRTNTV